MVSFCDVKGICQLPVATCPNSGRVVAGLFVEPCNSQETSFQHLHMGSVHFLPVHHSIAGQCHLHPT